MLSSSILPAHSQQKWFQVQVRSWCFDLVNWSSNFVVLLFLLSFVVVIIGFCARGTELLSSLMYFPVPGVRGFWVFLMGQTTSGWHQSFWLQKVDICLQNLKSQKWVTFTFISAQRPGPIFAVCVYLYVCAEGGNQHLPFESVVVMATFSIW